MSRPDPAGPSDTVGRFSRAERAVHWTFAALMITCLLTAAVLYNGSLGIRIGHRRAVELIHVWCGYALPVPLLTGLISSAFRRDLRRLDRFTDSDWRWLKGRKRRDASIRPGKFNAGQKLNACLTTGATGVLLGTGTLMFFPSIARLSWRTGATFVHDWVALCLGLLVLGHLAYALRDREARRGMRTGRVSADWAIAEHPAWADEVTRPPEHPPAEPAG